MKPPVCVLGATGQVGLYAVAGLLEAGREVIALTRQRPSGGDTGIPRLRRTDLAGFGGFLKGPPEGSRGTGLALLSCGPVALASELMESGPARAFGRWERAVVIGTTSTVSKGSSPDDAERREIEGIETALSCIRARCEAGGIPLTVLSPTLIYGCGMDQNLSRVHRWIRRTGFAPLAARAGGLRQPLHVADLAVTIVNAVQAEPAPKLESAVCGGSTLEYGEMIGLLFDVTGRKRRFLRLPEACFALAAGLASAVPGAGRVSSGMFRRQSRDLVFDDGPARHFLGHAPRLFRPTAADFCLSSRIDRIRQALLL